MYNNNIYYFIIHYLLLLLFNEHDINKLFLFWFDFIKFFNFSNTTIHSFSIKKPLGTLDKINNEIKQIIKQILHLHPSTTDGVIYSEKSHGGLSVQRVANIVKLAKLRNNLQMISPLREHSTGKRWLQGNTLRRWAYPGYAKSRKSRLRAKN